IKIIKSQFVDLAVGVNFTYTHKRILAPWNIQINIFCFRYIMSFVTSGKLEKGLADDGYGGQTAGSIQKSIDYIMED
ncbi:MAG TPA: hypothetical protein VNX68_18575, partial [Nitrosopumilaceae archaeon]|nr:hypothetical protein [Nitrosopumilaceae archaeon]